MLKVFLVEDEFVVREGIKNNIDWIEEGFKFCGDAADGELAYSIIINEKPDIIITDIRMPFMDGLELSRLVKKELPQCRIIILSGHEEFSYAQEAIKIGVTEYLLKPVSSTELIKTIKCVGQQITKERMEKENFERYRREMEENEVDLKRKLFNEMIEGSLSTAVMLERGKARGLELSASNYQLILLKYNFNGRDEIYSSELLAVNKEINRINSSFINIIAFDRAIEGIALLLKGESVEELEATGREYISKIKEAFSHYPDMHYFGGIGEPVGRLSLLSNSFDSAARVFSHRFISDKSAIVSIKELSTQNLNVNKSCSYFDAIEINGLNLKKAELFLRSGEKGEINFFIEEFLSGISNIGERSFLLKQYILMNIYFTTLTFLKEIGASVVTVEEPFDGPELMYERVNDIQKVSSYIERIFKVAIEKRDMISTKRYHRMIEQAKEYINEHFSDEGISLNETAAYVNISPNHFSAVFSRETGKSFIKYLTDLRIGKAKEMLKCTDLRCSDISSAVGYRDPHYFSYLFKRLQNCSPVQYRNSAD